ncbi:MAG: hypothetical protein IKM79_07540 [Bacteroidales bacterium]|nr:hypothetical protein [Bacteroidales bacterium]
MTKKKTNTGKGLLMTGSFRSAGMTFYLRHGQVVGRVAHSKERRSNTLEQFVQRQRMRHTIALWHTLKLCGPMFTESKTAYLGFASLANRLPAVFVPCTGATSGAALLMPGIPVSDGTLPEVKQRLGTVGADAALLTNLKAGDLRQNEQMILYTAEQRIEGRTPRVRFRAREVSRNEMTVVDGCLALTGDEFADAMKGWALVRINGERCSSQGIVTRCEYYLAYTTEEAIRTAAKSYGGLTQ